MSQEETVSSLIRIAVRGFYSIPHVLVIEALLMHKVLAEDDLRSLLNIQPKELRAICTRLLEDRLIVEFKQREKMTDGDREMRTDYERAHDVDEDGKPQQYLQRVYYFIHISVAVDSIKWKVDSMVRIVDAELSRAGEKGFVCPTCKKSFNELDVQSLFNDNFTEVYCNICNSVLVEDDYSEKSQEKQERSIKLKGQLDPFLQWLKKIDEIPSLDDNNIDLCFLTRVPSADQTNAIYQKLAKSSGIFDNTTGYNTGTGQKMLSQLDSATIRVNISGDGEDEARRKQEILQSKHEKAEQNALPSWYQESTVGKTLLDKEEAPEESSSSKPDTSTSEVQSVTLASDTSAQATKESDEIAAYYESLKHKKEDGDDDDDDDDFDDFEDV